MATQPQPASSRLPMGEFTGPDFIIGITRAAITPGSTVFGRTIQIHGHVEIRQISIISSNPTAVDSAISINLAIGDALPTTDAEFNAFPSLFPFFPGEGGSSTPAIFPGEVSSPIFRLSHVERFEGRRIIMRVTNNAGSGNALAFLQFVMRPFFPQQHNVPT